jgi:hypothetical protein
MSGFDLKYDRALCFHRDSEMRQYRTPALTCGSWRRILSGNGWSVRERGKGEFYVGQQDQRHYRVEPFELRGCGRERIGPGEPYPARDHGHRSGGEDAQIRWSNDHRVSCSNAFDLRRRSQNRFALVVFQPLGTWARHRRLTRGSNS